MTTTSKFDSFVACVKKLRFAPEATVIILFIILFFRIFEHVKFFPGRWRENWKKKKWKPSLEVF